MSKRSYSTTNAPHYSEFNPRGPYTAPRFPNELAEAEQYIEGTSTKENLRQWSEWASSDFRPEVHARRRPRPARSKHATSHQTAIPRIRLNNLVRLKWHQGASTLATLRRKVMRQWRRLCRRRRYPYPNQVEKRATALGRFRIK